MADKGTPDGIRHAKATGDDDVEGHGFSHAKVAEPDGIRHAKVAEPDGIRHAKVTGDDDVEGHSFHLRSPSSRGE